MLALLDLLGRRWALRILWELRMQPASFQALHRRCDFMSTSVLSQRLAELGEAQLIDKGADGGYALTEHGDRLLSRLDGIDEWTQEWARTIGCRGGRSAARTRLTAGRHRRVARPYGTQ